MIPETLSLAVGEWKIGSGDNFISFALTEKPNWFRRTMANLFFGLVWKDFNSPSYKPKPSKGISIHKTIDVPKNRRTTLS